MFVNVCVKTDEIFVSLQMLYSSRKPCKTVIMVNEFNNFLFSLSLPFFSYYPHMYYFQRNFKEEAKQIIIGPITKRSELGLRWVK